MKIKIKAYKMKSGEFMFYVNNLENGVSLGIGKNVFTSKFTKGQKNLFSDFLDLVKDTKPTIENFQPLKEHTEPYAKLGYDFEMFVTDKAEVAGHNVVEDGFYFAFNGHLYSFDNVNQAR